MDEQVQIRLPDIWGDATFEEDKWGDLNYLIGPNGTGKTLFADELREQLTDYSVRYLSADRLSGMVESSSDYQFTNTHVSKGFNLQNENDYRITARNRGYSSDAYLLLRDKPDLRIRVQAVLSEYFGRDIDLTVEGGFLIPTMIDQSTSTTYDLRESESHGLKELISLLTIIYDDEPDVIIIDEPELHLHPQYQKFLLHEIQNLAGEPGDGVSKTFFLVTHSPTMLEFRNIDDMLNTFSFREKSSPPLTVEDFSDQDEYHISGLIPRLDTRHKEALFSREPILVEGYTDEQIFSLIIEKHESLRADPGSTIVSVDGKENINVLFRFCQALGLEPRIIADLDVLFSGGLRQTLSNLESVNSGLQDAGSGPNLMNAIGTIESILNEFSDEILNSDELDGRLLDAQDVLNSDIKGHRKRYATYKAISLDPKSSFSVLGRNEVRGMIGRMDTILDVLGSCGYHILSKGELEDYLDSNIPLLGANSNTKSEMFQRARNELLECSSPEEICDTVDGLVNVLSAALGTRDVSLLSYMEGTVSQWIHDVQTAFFADEISSLSDLKDHPELGDAQYERLFTIQHFSRNNGGFDCRISINESLDPDQTLLEFDDDTVAPSISLAN